ncbi:MULTISPECIES: OmpA family protein [Acetobacter]|nr:MULTISPECIES: OmpA family protein [Acetobacter]MBO1360996.1 OmpA family protein [Acetobacter sacchari]
MRRLFPALALCLLAGCTTGPGRKYVVFFSESSTTLDDASKNVISEAAAMAAKYPQADVRVEGYARANGDLSADSALAIDRAKLVAQQLSDDGVAASRISQHPRAPSNADGTVGARRVEIEFVSH